MNPQPTERDRTLGLSEDARAERFAGLDDQSLLAFMLEPRRACGNARQVVANLFQRFGSLAAIAAADTPELRRIGGVDEAVTAQLRMLQALCERLARSEAARRPVVSSWSALVAYVRVTLAQAPREQFRALFLDRRNQLLQDELIGHGTVDHAPVYPREVVRRALELSASAIILVHNHPSGDPEPSRADIEMTRKVADAARVFDIEVHDHLIVGRDGTASFRTLGLF